MTMNRRSFLAGGLAGTAAALSGAPHATPILAPKKWDETHDVVIVGAGAAGLTAACEAVGRGPHGGLRSRGPQALGRRL